MAKRLSDIDKEIRESNDLFNIFFVENISYSIQKFILNLRRQTDVYLFSGIIRDYFLFKNNELFIRDIDLVIKNNVVLDKLLRDTDAKKNSFGGYKFVIDDISIDIWTVEKTWGLKYYPSLFPTDLYANLLKTTFFSFSSILYHFNKNKFIYDVNFKRFLRDKELRLVLPENPYPELCIVNTRYYSETRKLKLNKNIISYIQKHKHISSFEHVQKKHFGKVIYTNNDMQIWIKRQLKL